ncbi:MAG: nucleoside-diphosphate kinase [Candidatus Marsarchaeota archaeon]|nr:nucleoside-diphosphate kinase [Candidatus Marsarchaeota archaeon]
MSRELIFLGPDAIDRKLVGKVITMFEDSGFKIVKMKKGKMSDKLAKLMYVDTEEYFKGRGEKTLTGMKENNISEDEVRKIFGSLDPVEMGRQIVSWKRQYETAGDIIGVIVEGEDAANRTRKLIGYTDPSKADRGTVRGDLGNDSIMKANMERRAVFNLLHASDDDRAEVEIKYFEDNFF